MHKLSRVAAGSAFLFCCNSLWAQSSVTLYGLIDVGIQYSTNSQTGKSGDQLQGAHQLSMADGATRGIGGSRWGLKGSEDLGGGYHAIFTVENGFSITNGTLGQGGLMFGRQAFVGIDSPYGTLTFGRQYDTEADFVSPYTPYMFAALTGALPGDVDGDAHTRRTNNTIKYKSPDFRGFRFGGMYSLGGIAGDPTRSQIWALGASYAYQGFSVGAGYYNGRNPNLSVFGNSGNSGPATSNNLGSFGSATTAQSNPIYAGYASAHTYEVYATGMNYNFGRFTAAALYAHVSFDDLGDISSGPNPLHYRGKAVFNNAEASLMYKISPAFFVGGAYTYTHNGGANGFGGANYHQAILAGQYFLSKRTELYASGVYQVASGTDSLGQPAVANQELVTPSSNNHQLVFRAGILHSF